MYIYPQDHSPSPKEKFWVHICRNRVRIIAKSHPTELHILYQKMQLSKCLLTFVIGILYPTFLPTPV